MAILSRLTALILTVGLLPAFSLAAQDHPDPPPITEIRIPRTGIGPSSWMKLSGPARPGEYLGVTGPRAAWLGYETGEGEVWAHPLKVVGDVSLAFKIPAYPNPIPGRQVARRVEGSPGHWVVTYSHAAFVVREHVMVPPDLPGVLLLLEVDAVEELEIHVEFQPVLQYAWPGGFGGQYLFWDRTNRAFLLSESLRERNGIIGSPWATEGSAHPAHRLAEAPSVFVIPVDRDRAREELIPIAVTGAVAPRNAVVETYRELLERGGSLPEELAREARSRSRNTLRIRAPWRGAPGAGAGMQSRAAEVLEWAKVNLAEQRVCNPDLGCGLVAGWGPSGTSLRPGFGWFFGGDAAINTLAMDATGQWEEVAEGLRFLARYQREDGKIPHEISQAAGRISWFQDFPYAYYHADTTPYWMLALWYYWRASADEELVRELWPAYRKAWEWCLSVETDGDGIIENTTGGLGAIEVGGLGEGMHQDIYLAGAWITALGGTEEMAAALGDPAMASRARDLYARARETLNRAYWMPEEGYHAFGLLQGGGTNGNLTAWPGTALAFGLLDAERAGGTLRHLATDAIASSWGARLLSTGSDLYDPLHYNNGMVWPFMTGYVAWGQYRYRRPWAGFHLLNSLWRLHGDWGLGRHPENLSGAFYQTLEATVPHQFFATSMLVTPLARGLLGWEPDAPRGRATLAPQPPPSWPGMSVRSLRVGESRVDVEYRRESNRTRVNLTIKGPPVEITYIQPIPPGARDLRVRGAPEGAGERQVAGRHDIQHHLTFELQEGDEVRMDYRWKGGLEVYPAVPTALAPGSPSGGVRILDFTPDGDGWRLEVEGDGGSTGTVLVRGEAVEAEGGRMGKRDPETGQAALEVIFPDTGPRVIRTVRLQPTAPGASPESGVVRDRRPPRLPWLPRASGTSP